MRVGAAFDGFHGLDFFGRILDGKKLRFAFSQAVSGGDGTAQFGGFFGKDHEGFGTGVEFLPRGGEHIHERVRIAGAAENTVVAGRNPFHAFAIECEHFAILFDRHEEVRAE